MAAAPTLSASTFTGQKLSVKSARARTSVNRTVVASGKKIDVNKQGLSSIKDDVVKANLQGVSRKMKDKNWKDSQGRKGKGFGVYRFSDKYGANVDGYSPIYTPDLWSEGGDSYKLGTTGLIAWAGLVVVLFSVGATLIYTTSQL